MILLLGKSDLAHAIQHRRPDCVIAGRPEFDLSLQQDCDRLVDSFDPTVVVNTVALNADHNVWDIMTVNTTSMMYLTMLWYNKSSVRHIINVSSTSTYWVSYPGIEDGRFAYNFSKWCVSHFGRELNRKIMEDPQAVISTVELGSFASKFNSHAIGRMNLQQAADTVLSVINNPVTAVSRIH